MSQLPRTTKPLSLAVLLVPTIVYLIAEHHPHTSLYEDFGQPAAVMAEDVLAGTPIRRGSALVLAAFGLVILVVRRGEKASVSGSLGALMGTLLAWSCASVLWSVDPMLTLRRLVLLWAMCLAGTAIAKNCTPSRITLWVLMSTALYLVLGILAEGALDSFAPTSPGYRFAGTLHPNSQGVNCGLLALAGLPMAMEGKRFRLPGMLIVWGALGFLTLTRSRASIASLLCAALVYGWLRSRRANINVALAAGAILAAALALALLLNSFSPFLLRSLQLGREDADVATLTGRMQLWTALLDEAARRPFLGHGYGAFWTDARILQVSHSIGWMASNAHSAYLDVLLHLGIVGLLCYVLVLTLAVGRAASCAIASGDRHVAIQAALVTFSLVHGVVESHAFSTTFATLVYITVLIRLSLTSQAPQSQPRSLTHGSVSC